MVDANTAAPDPAASLHDAFISYSRRDKDFASRLGAALRAYKPPKGLGLEPRHLDIFRDEEDFTGVEYHEAVHRHLRASSRLVLICSPSARKSEYVNDEIRQFVAMRGGDSIVPVLVSGLPNNEARDDQEGEKAFPEALCEALRMPLAIDYRGFDPGGKQKVNKDAFHGAWCSLLANLYGLSRSEIEQREKKRETRRRRITRSIVGGVMATLLAATAISVTFWRQAVAQRTAAVARQLAAQAELTRNQSPKPSERSVLLAVESLKHLPTLEAELVLRPQLVKMLRPARRISMGGESLHYRFSADRKLVAAATAEGVKIYELLTGKGLPVLDPVLPMMAFQFSPDGNHFATGSGSLEPSKPGNYVAQVWRLQDGKEIARLPYTKPLNMLFFNADGRYLATIDDEFARVWEVDAERKLRREFEHDARLVDGALSPDGRRLFTQTSREVNRVWREVNRVWDVAAGKVLEDVKLSAGEDQIGFSPDWRRVATSSNDSIRITELDGGAEVARIQAPNMTLPTFTEDGQWLMARDENNSVFLWDAKGSERLRVRRVNGLDRFLISPDREYAATLNFDELVQIWSDTDREVSRLDGSGVLAIAYVADGKFLATADTAGWVQLWETTHGREAARLPHGHSVQSIAYTPDGKHLVTESSDFVVRVWDIAASREVAGIPTAYGAHVALDPVDGKRLVVSFYHATRVFETLTGHEITTLKMTHGNGKSVFTRDGKYLATAGDSIVRVWEMPSAREIAPPFPLGDAIGSIVFSPDGKFLVVSTSNSRTAVVWDLATRDVVARFEEGGGYGRVAFSPDGRYIAATVSPRFVGPNMIPVGGGDVLIWNPRTGTEVHRLKQAGAILAFSPNGKLLVTDGKTLATTGTEFNARIWNVVTGREVKQLRHRAEIRAGAFTLDGARLLTASADGAARSWDLVTGREISRIQPDAGILSFAVSPDGKYLATGDDKGVVRIWFLRPGDLIAEACSRLTRNLTQDEWREFIGDEPYAPTCPNLK
jgi:WD40 repeat protein